MTDMWSHRHGDVSTEITGFDVEAADSKIGSVTEADLPSGQFTVDMGLLGPKVMLPVGVIAGVDEQTRTIRLDRTKDEVKSAPEFDGVSVRVPAYRAKLENY